jgi:hypothetical protein
MTRTMAARIAGVTFLAYVTWAVWFPVLVFELAFSAWLIAKGVAMPARRQVA